MTLYHLESCTPILYCRAWPYFISAVCSYWRAYGNYFGLGTMVVLEISRKLTCQQNKTMDSFRRFEDQGNKTGDSREPVWFIAIRERLLEFYSDCNTLFINIFWHWRAYKLLVWMMQGLLSTLVR